MTVCSHPEDGRRCWQGVKVKPPVKLKTLTPGAMFATKLWAHTFLEWAPAVFKFACEEWGGISGLSSIFLSPRSDLSSMTLRFHVTIFIHHGIRTKSHWTKTHRTISKRTKSKEDKNPGGQNPMGTNAQGDNIQVRQKPRGTKAQGDKNPQGQKPMEDNIQADNIPGGQNPKICVFVLGACVYCIGASRT